MGLIRDINNQDATPAEKLKLKITRSPEWDQLQKQEPEKARLVSEALDS